MALVAAGVGVDIATESADAGSGFILQYNIYIPRQSVSTDLFSDWYVACVQSDLLSHLPIPQRCDLV